MKANQNYLSLSFLLSAAFFGALMCSCSAQAQTGSAQTGVRNSYPVLPLEQAASRGITTRDPSSIVKCKEDYWVRRGLAGGQSQ
jgi:hypothetical protein